MQKVVGSSPIIRFGKTPGVRGFSFFELRSFPRLGGNVNSKCQLDAASRCPKPSPSAVRIESAARALSNRWL
jgi:hypothetical protein